MISREESQINRFLNQIKRPAISALSVVIILGLPLNFKMQVSD